MSTDEGSLAGLLDEHERDLRDLLSRLDVEGLSPDHWREDARRLAASSARLTARAGELRELEGAGPRLEDLLRLNAVARRGLEARLANTAARISRARNGRRHLAERGEGDPSARSCDLSV